MEMNVKFRLSISFGVPTCFINVGSWEERAQVRKRGSFSESSFWSRLRWTAEISLNNSAFLAIIQKVKAEKAEELNYPNKIKTVWKTSSFCRWKKFSACLASHSNQSNPDARFSFSVRSVHSWKLSSTARSIVYLPSLLRRLWPHVSSLVCIYFSFQDGNALDFSTSSRERVNFRSSNFYIYLFTY